jgi:hypothetical protein
MPPITTEAQRVIIDDFARLIKEKATKGSKPEKTVINFRDEKRNGFERDIVQVPLSLLRYRKENGRIASDVLNHERSNGVLHEQDDKAQEILGKFLEEKDAEPTDALMKSIEHTGQNEPAIITCDGFLINGNRRKMALEKLKAMQPGRSEYGSMKVVILPGRGEAGGPPTLLEIEQLENRYQLQSDGKAEYFSFDQALSIARKMRLGFSLKAQLQDDPRYVRAGEKELNQAVEALQQEYLRPLECVDRYLALFGREGLYGTVAASRGDREGRWQAFKDYSHTYHNYFKDPHWMMEKGVDDADVGGLEDAVFKIIKLRDLRGLKKLHQVMRDLRRMCSYQESRKEILKISDDVEADLPEKERRDPQGNPLTLDKLDEKWAQRHQQTILHHLKKAIEHQERNQDKETPISLLKAALQKLNHESMTVSSMAVGDYPEARKLAAGIQTRANEIEKEIFHAGKEFDSLGRKK